MKKKTCLLLLLIGASVTSMAQQKDGAVYLDLSAPLEERVEDALGRLTVEEKVALCHAQSKFSSKGVARLGIPEVSMSDGPHGIRAELEWDGWNYLKSSNDYATAFPSLVALAATWNPEMSLLYGKAIGEEARYRKKDVLLGPGCNICRTPLNGRSFEYLGEDPYLVSEMVAPYVRGVQQSHVAACVKHFALNNQELNRMHVNVKVSDRALREIYLPAFKAAVDAGTWSIMGSYSQYLNQRCCHNEVLLNRILKEEWAFDGAVISDWGGCHDTRQAAAYGLDIEMGTNPEDLSYSKDDLYENYYLARPYLNALRRGDASMKDLDEKARRVLRLIFRTQMSADRPWGSLATEEHARQSRIIAQDGIVLLKNEGILPLKPERNLRIAVIGDNAVRLMSNAGGASEVKTLREITPLQAIEEKYGKENVTFAMGYDGGAASYSQVIPATSDAEELRTEALRCAGDADIVLFFGGLNKNMHQDCENSDRLSYDLPYGQKELIEALARVNENLVVVLISGNAVDTSWDKDVKALVESWYLGSESGHAIADVLAGDVNPSGKLPVSFYERLEDCGAHSFGTQAYPGDGKDVEYLEDILVGYRWLDAKGIQAKYPFGYGLSYSTFQIGKAGLDKKQYAETETIRITVPVTNCGPVSGKEVVQVYVGKKHSDLLRAPKELKAFEKVYLRSGESSEVSLDIPVERLAYWDESTSQWRIEKGVYQLYVGNSSQNTRQYVISVK